MKRLLLWIIALASLSGNALLAQSLVGTWQGTMQAGRQLRVVFKISTTDADTLKAVMYSIDQGAQGLNATSVTLQGSAVKMSIVGIGAAYQGTLSSDGNSISGTWSQGAGLLPLNLKRATPETAWTIPEPPPPPKPMPADANPVFEVSTIKPSKPDTPGKSFLLRGREFTTTNTTLSDLITFAYDIHPNQVTGGPAWLESDKYDVVAKPDLDGQPSVKQLRTMVQKLLTDRFQLTFHRDRKELTVYTLVPGKTASKLTPSDADPNGLPSLFFGGLGRLTVRNATVPDFTALMQTTVLDRPVVDQTGLAGHYDFTLTWTPDETQFGGRGGQIPPPADGGPPAAPDLYTAIQQQMGLKMESAKLPVDVLVIDKVERPSAN